MEKYKRVNKKNNKKNNKSKISALMCNKKFELPDGSYYASDYSGS